MFQRVKDAWRKTLSGAERLSLQVNEPLEPWPTDSTDGFYIIDNRPREEVVCFQDDVQGRGNDRR